MKCSAKYVVVTAVKDKTVADILFLDWETKRGAAETAKMHGWKPLSSKSGAVEAEFELADVCEATLTAEFGAMISHDYMYDVIASSILESEVQNHG